MAATKSSKNGKAKSSKTLSASKISKKSKLAKHKKYKNKRGKKKRYSHRRRSGNGPDLRALTTVSPYTDDLDNGINSVETKLGL